MATEEQAGQPFKNACARDGSSTASNSGDSRGILMLWLALKDVHYYR